MKRIAIPIIMLLSQHVYAQVDTSAWISKDSFYTLSPVEVRAIRATDDAPIAKTNISKQQIAKMNLGQDLPFLLNQTPSVVVNADAGNGIGYTGIRIRGTDATRINVTLNGIPYNDAESQGTFFVDLPDLSSSTGSIQVQRGVGSSSNGAGAFGGNINVSTNEVLRNPYAEINNSYGSFDTWKNTIKVGTGLVNNHFTTDIRLSNISSNGYIDRAQSTLKSFYLSTAWISNTNSLRLNIFSGKEKTYQAWYGISELDLLEGRRKINYAGTEKPGTPYEKETDNYTQTHYQLFYNQLIKKSLSFNTAIFLTKGEGYYEQYKSDEPYSKYGIAGNGNSDFVRQLWLDNDYYGSIFSLQYKKDKSLTTLGGSITNYDGRHFGEIIWASNGMPEPKFRWYDHPADKDDYAVYLKHQYSITPALLLYGDVQYRHVNYTINGFRDNPDLKFKNDYNFFNPKAGITYHSKGFKAFVSYAVANKEPNRDDFETSHEQKPLREQLHDLESGIGFSTKKYSWLMTLFYMKYKDQLVLTGKINDIGAYTRTNIPKSYRAGIELEGAFRPNHLLNISANLAYSRNKVQNFVEFIDDYDLGGQKDFSYHSTDIAFSPSIVGSGMIELFPLKNLELSFISKYVDDQYLDNTENKSRKLDKFFTEDFRIIYTLKPKFIKEISLIAQANNVFDTKYEPNGYTYSYIYGGALTTENYYFPMAGRNFLVSVNIKL